MAKESTPRKALDTTRSVLKEPKLIRSVDAPWLRIPVEAITALVFVDDTLNGYYLEEVRKGEYALKPRYGPKVDIL